MNAIQNDAGAAAALRLVSTDDDEFAAALVAEVVAYLERKGRPTSYVVPQLAKQATRAYRAWLAADADLDFEGCAFARDRLDALAAEAAFHPSGNATGALFQLAILTGMRDAEPSDEDAAEALYRRHTRLVEQVARYLERTGGINWGELGWPSFYLDPVAANDA